MAKSDMTSAPLQRGDQMPHVEVTTLDGGLFAYTSVWQHQNLVLVTLPDAGSDTSLVSQLAARDGDFRNLRAACIVTRDRVPGLPAPGVLVADRWGEIVHVAIASAELPAASELLDWLDYVERRCPECEGEAK